MEKSDVIRRIKEEKIISVIRTNKPEKIDKIIEAIINGGIHLIEITMTVPNAIEIIERLSDKYANTDITIGAGTVLDEGTAKRAIMAGTQFIVSPIFNKNIIKLCNESNILGVPGIATPNEAFEAMQSGAEILKLFPSNTFSPNIIKTYKGPFPEIKLIPTGGINLDNISDWINNGAIAVGIGGELMKNFNDDNYEEITKNVLMFKEKIKN